MACGQFYGSQTLFGNPCGEALLRVGTNNVSTLPGYHHQAGDDSAVFAEQDVIGAARGGGVHDLEADTGGHQAAGDCRGWEAQPGAGAEDHDLRIQGQEVFDMVGLQVFECLRGPVIDDRGWADNQRLLVDPGTDLDRTRAIGLYGVWVRGFDGKLHDWIGVCIDSTKRPY